MLPLRTLGEEATSVFSGVGLLLPKPLREDMDTSERRRCLALGDGEAGEPMARAGSMFSLLRIQCCTESLPRTEPRCGGRR